MCPYVYSFGKTKDFLPPFVLSFRSNIDSRSQGGGVEPQPFPTLHSTRNSADLSKYPCPHTSCGRLSWSGPFPEVPLVPPSHIRGVPGYLIRWVGGESHSPPSSTVGVKYKGWYSYRSERTWGEELQHLLSRLLGLM